MKISVSFIAALFPPTTLTSAQRVSREQIYETIAKNGCVTPDERKIENL